MSAGVAKEVMDLKSLTIDAARSRVQEGKTTATELAEAFYSRIEKDDSQIGAYVTLSKDRALRQAARIDALAAKGEPLPPLVGVPVAVKDVMATSGAQQRAPRPAQKCWAITFHPTTVRR